MEAVLPAEGEDAQDEEGDAAVEKTDEEVKDKTVSANDSTDAAATTEAAPVAEGEAAVDKDEHETAVASNLDYGGVPNPTAAPKAGEEAKKPADAAKDPAAAKKAGAAAPTKPAYSPILDEAVNMVGICNKAHKKTINVIQVLYCKASTNAMM